jgi:trigger factor
VKVELKDLSETRKQLAVAFEAAEVDQELQKVTGDFVRHAKIPGFRPGRAPVAMVHKRYEKEIAKELKQAVVSRAYRDGMKESGADVIQVIDVPDAAIEAGTPAQIIITVEINPTFDVPEYKGLPLKAGDVSVTGEEVDGVVENLRREKAEFKTIDRAAETGDYVKFGFEGKIDGASIAELVPDRPIFGAMPQTWEEAGAGEGLLPGAGKALVGLKAGDTQEVQIAFPEKFQVPQLAGKTGEYTFNIQEVRQRILPEIDEAFLKLQNVATVEELREQIEQSVVARKQQEDRGNRRRQALEALSAKVEFPIPESLIENETSNLLQQIVEQNVRQGVPQEELEKNKEEVFATARKAAVERVKSRMLLARVAEAEKLEVTRDDINRVLHMQAMRSGQRPEKFVKELQKDRDRVRALQQDILLDKALDFLVDKGTLSES